MDELMLGTCAYTTTSSLQMDTTLSSPSLHYASSAPFDSLMDCHYADSSDLLMDIATMEHQTDALSLCPSSASPPPSRRNLIIWDWDDTIFPTFSFRTHQDRKDKLFMTKLRTLVSLTEEVFECMIAEYGAENIVIVTNASANWIQKCLEVELIEAIYASFRSMLSKHRIDTISASTPSITKQHPDDPHKWKEVVFSRLFDQHFGPRPDGDDHGVDLGVDHGVGGGDKSSDEVQCITSIGDSLCEFKASDRASQWMEHRVLNRLRLRPNPSIDEMIEQFKTIVTVVHDFGATAEDIELDFTAPPSPTLSLSNDSMTSNDTL